jgi:hypothetical protein
MESIEISDIESINSDSVNIDNTPSPPRMRNINSSWSGVKGSNVNHNKHKIKKAQAIDYSSKVDKVLKINLNRNMKKYGKSKLHIPR